MNTDSFRCGLITLAGKPNVGKSTLMNRLIGQKIAITANKPQTTRDRIRTIYTDDTCQMVFVDTPGLHKAKNRLGEYMMQAAKSALEDVDLILLLVEPDPHIKEEDAEILKMLTHADQPVIVVVNKKDTVPAERAQAAVAAYAQAAPFAKVLSVAALKGDGVEALREEMKGFLPFGPPLYDEDALTDEPERDVCAEILREKALRLLSDEVPHGIAVLIEKMRERKSAAGEAITDIEATIICEKDTHKGIVIGKQGRMLAKIGRAARIDMEKLLGQKVNLQIFVKVRKDWRDNETQLRAFGYREK